VFFVWPVKFDSPKNAKPSEFERLPWVTPRVLQVPPNRLLVELTQSFALHGELDRKFFVEKLSNIKMAESLPSVKVLSNVR